MPTITLERTESAPDLADDLLSGVKAFANHTGLPERRIRHMIENHEFPVRKVGGLFYSRRSWIDRYFSGEEDRASGG
jgi:hypothetical protein